MTPRLKTLNPPGPLSCVVGPLVLGVALPVIFASAAAFRVGQGVLDWKAKRNAGVSPLQGLTSASPK